MHDSSVPTADPAPDRQFGWVHRDERYACELRVTLTKPKRVIPIEGTVHDLSLGGLFLATSRRLGLDKRVALDLPLPDGPLTVTGQIVWSRRTPQGQSPAGLGLKFDPLTGKDHDRLDAFLDTLELVEPELSASFAGVDYEVAEDG